MRSLIIPIMDKDFIKMLEGKKVSQTNAPQQNFLNEITRKIMLG